ncbi:MAG: phage tail protein [Proteobacteria bacterium]|nr:phage tail protein [Pseudomonadota bacterium]
MSDQSDPADLGRRELVGPTGVPAGSGYFDIDLQNGTLAAGRCYVNGLACVNETDRPLFEKADIPDGAHLIYIDAWEQDPARDDPFFTRRPALGQPHPFGAGLRTVWLPRHLRVGDKLEDVNVRDFESGWRPPENQLGTLQARANQSIEVDALYRVEIHAAPDGDAPALFKSSANNGMTASRLQEYRRGDNQLVLESTLDDYPFGQGFRIGKPVEVVEQISPAESRSWLATITEASSSTITVDWLDDDDVPGPGLATAGRVVVRQWDRVAEVRLGHATGLDSDGGQNTVEVRFAAGAFEPGDYWLIPARADRNNILWPVAWNDGDADDGFAGPARPPDGIVHHYCPVGLLMRTGAEWVAVSEERVLPELETVTQVAREINPRTPSHVRVPTERAVKEYADDRLHALEEITETLDGGAERITGYRVEGSLEVEQGLTVTGGQVGIGTNDPDARLHVNGRIRDETGDVMPVGGIIMWSGAESDIPAGWVLCNGANNTPDLRSRFIVGAGPGGSPAYEPGTSGGPDSHHHLIDVPAQTVDTSTHGGHSHKMPDKWSGRNFRTGGVGATKAGIDRHSGDPGATRSQTDGAHHHSVTIDHPAFDSGTSSTTEIRPQWYALCFIMKT